MSINESLLQQIVDETVNYYLDTDNKTEVYVECKDNNGAYRFEPFGSTYFLANLRVYPKIKDEQKRVFAKQ